MKGTEDQRTFYPEASLFVRGCLLAASGPKFRGLEGAEKLNQNSLNKNLVPNDPWRQQAVQVIISEAKEGDSEACVLPYLVISK